MINEDSRKKLVPLLSGMKERVSLLYFTQDIECGICREVHQFLDEFCSLSDKINLSSIDFVAEKTKADYYGVDKIPALLLLDKNDNDSGIRFYGVPAGYEINSFVAALLDLSGNRKPLPDALTAKIQSIKKPVHIQVFISTSCPYCPDAVIGAHRLAIENKLIRADMVDASIFTPLAIRFNVSGVPKTIINGRTELVGAQTIDALVESVLKELNA